MLVLLILSVVVALGLYPIILVLRATGSSDLLVIGCAVATTTYRAGFILFLIFNTFFCLVTSAYLILVSVSPHLLAASPTEKQYVSAKSPTKPIPLPSLSDEASIDLSVIIPAYNETERLTPMLEVTLTHLLGHPSRSYELVIVDDGSKDATVSLALSLAQAHANIDIRVVKMDRNVGKGGAVRHGFLHARGERLLMVDADGASQFEDLELLWKEMDAVEKCGRAVAVGSRAHMVKTEAVVKRSAVRNFLMYGFHFVLRTLGVGHIRDTQCGFKLFSRKAAQQLFPFLHLRTWVFDVELLIMAQILEIPVVEVPIAWHEVAGSKLSLISDSLGMLKDLLVLRANYALGRWSVQPKKAKAE
ncbi:glycosyltransferase family 2 protein [Ramaria rubella]|nr:glycosyltransferase family 2 protein [Ramaria rubella]